MEWQDGYVTGVQYVRAVHRELSPSALNLVLLIQGLEPVALTDGFTYCDLGCGQGESVNFFAACHPEGEFHAVDFNAAHIAGARSLAASADLGNAAFWEASFADLKELPLPAFDFIVIHGVYTWVGAKNRRFVLEFLRDRLKPGGVVYLSYNSLPGWSAHAPLRQLLYTYAETQSGTLAQRVDRAVEFVERLKTANAAIFEASPATGEFFEYIRTLPRNYLAHEFFNRDWTLFYHAEVVQELAEAKLTYSGPANFAENHDMLRFSEAQQLLIDGVTDRVMRESAKDFATNPLLRRDLFTRGRPEIDSRRQERHLNGCRFALVLPQAQLERKALFPIGEAHLERELYDPILFALEKQAQSLEELQRRPEIAGLGAARVRAALTVLLSAEYVMPAVEPTEQAVWRTGRLNRALLERDAGDTGKRHLASPVLQSAVRADWLERTLIRCELEGETDPLPAVLEKLRARRRKLGDEGAHLPAEDAHQEEVAAQIHAFCTFQAPLLRQLGVM